MLLETVGELTTTPYQEYVDLGGCLTEEDFDLALYLMNGGELLYTASLPSFCQITSIADSAGIGVTPEEIEIYQVLRNRRRSDYNFPISENGDNGSFAHTLSDQELVGQIFLLTDRTREKYMAITGRYPNIFKEI